MPTYSKKEKKAFGRKMAAQRARRSSSRRYNKVSGRGFYKGFGRDLGSFIGGAVGKVSGIPGLGRLGGALGARGSKITGFGSYNVENLNHNSLVLPPNPRIVNSIQHEGATIVRHREYIGDVVSSTGFVKQYEIPINPGLDGSFPWLAPIANSFQQWQCNGMVFEYVSSSGDAVSSTNNALGQVMMGIQFDSVDDGYANKQQMLNDSWAQAFSPSAHGAMPVECAPNQTSLTQLYTRHGDVPANADKRLYDIGRLTVATQGMQAADITVGSLYVVYDIVLLKPQLSHSLGLTAATAHYHMTTPTAAAPLGSGDAVKHFDSVGLTLTSTRVTLPRNTAGKWLLDYYVVGSSALIVPPVISYNNCEALVIQHQDTLAVTNNQLNAANDTLKMTITFIITDPSQESSIDFGVAGTLPVPIITGRDLFLTQLNYGVES